MADTQSLLVKEIRFTDTEVITMQEWLRAVLVGNLVRADRILKDGLHFEHWDALLSEHPAERTEENIAQFEVYKKAFAEALKSVNVEMPRAQAEATFEPVGGQLL